MTRQRQDAHPDGAQAHRAPRDMPTTSSGSDAVGPAPAGGSLPRPRAIALAAAIGLVLYAALYGFAEYLVHEYGHRNPFYKVATAPGEEASLVILGASHALPLEYGDMHAVVEEHLGVPVMNLATPGGGMVPNSLLLDYMLAEHGEEDVRLVVYVLDSFTFHAAEWNEDRLADARLWQRAPLDATLVRVLWRATRELGVPQSVFWSYVSAFSKLNDPATWFQPDVWPDEAKFTDSYTTSELQDQSRIDYLYPEPPAPEAVERYETMLVELAERLRSLEVPLIVIAPPLREEFASRIPGEAAFQRRATELFDRLGVPYYDLSGADYDESLYLDPDHLNRDGALYFLRTEFAGIVDAHLER